MKPGDFETGKVLYEECGTHLRYMLEWRHKLLLRFFVLNGSFLIIVKWMWESNNGTIKMFVFVPLLLGGFASCVFYIMDRRNMQVVKTCRDTGSKIENDIFKCAGLFMHMGVNIEQTRSFFSYTWMLTLMYLGCALIMLIGAVIAFRRYGGWQVFSMIAG